MTRHTSISWKVSLLKKQGRIFKFLIAILLMIILTGCAGTANTLGLRKSRGAEVKVVTVTDLEIPGNHSCLARHFYKFSLLYLQHNNATTALRSQIFAGLFLFRKI